MINKLKSYGEVHENISLKEHNTYHIGGLARYLIYPDNIDKLILLISFLRENNVKYKIFGNGSNMIISSKNYDGVIIKLTNLSQIKIDSLKKEVFVEAGVMLPRLAYAIIEEGLVGFEWAVGIPGTIGGSIVGNAGAYNVEIFDKLNSVTIINEQGILETLKVNQIKHDYRHSEFQERDVIIISATFTLEKGTKEEALAIINTRREKRIASQPLEYPSAGSVFRNPTEEELSEASKKYNIKGPFAGHLIEECALKGKSINGAEISIKHANFIINKNNASSEDIKALIDLVVEEVLKKYNCKLKTEQEFFNWE